MSAYQALTILHGPGLSLPKPETVEFKPQFSNMLACDISGGVKSPQLSDDSCLLRLEP